MRDYSEYSDNAAFIASDGGAHSVRTIGQLRMKATIAKQTSAVANK
jgi:hypothetical protein